MKRRRRRLPVPWSSRMDWARGILVCSWWGHKFRPKMYGDMCVRCALFRIDPGRWR